MGIPTYIVEEHKEAFYCWHYMIHAGEIPPVNNILLHVDTHDDFSGGYIGADFLQKEMDLPTAHHYAYDVLNILNFIKPAILKKIFSVAVWLNNDNKPVEEQFIRIGLSDQGFVGEFPIPPEEMRKPGEQPDNVVDIFNIRGTICDDYRTVPPLPLVLDIDLDFFCCDASCSYARNRYLEITKDEYERYQNDPYHLLRMEFSYFKPYKKDGRYFLSVNENIDKEYASEQQIIARMNDFFLWLDRRQIVPAAIDICRSRFSGYLPAPVFPWIENELLTRLNNFYGIDIKCRPGTEIP